MRIWGSAMTELGRHWAAMGSTIAVVIGLALPSVAEEDPNWPVDRYNEVLSGITHAVALGELCQAIFLTGANPLPTGYWEMLDLSYDSGTITATAGIRAPFQDRLSEMVISIYNEEDTYVTVECEGVAHLYEGTAEDVWGGLRRYERGVGVTLTGLDLGEPAPDLLRVETCLMDVPGPGLLSEMEVRFVRAEPGSDDMIVRFSGLTSEDWDYGCVRVD